MAFPKALDNKGMVPLLTFAGGVFNLNKESKKSAEFQIEYRFANSFFMARPMIGAFMTSKSAFYAYTGIGWDLHLSRFLVMTPSFSPGIYFKGNDRDLGYPLEFRSCIEFAYKFQSKGRLGLEFYHVSNASLGEKNPGSESLLLFYSLPLKY